MSVENEGKDMTQIRGNSVEKKGSKKAIIWIIVVLIVVATTIMFVNIYPMLSMKPAATGEIDNTGITAIKNGHNTVYLIKSDTEFILIDAGNNLAKLEEAFSQLSIDPEEVGHVFITHADSDHIDGLTLFSNAQFYISEDELQMLDRSTKRNGFGYSSLPDGFDIDRFMPLTDDQELLIGDFSILSIKTPGHTPGSMSFIVNQDYLFTGDVFRISDNKLSVHPFSMDEDLSKETITRLIGYFDDCNLVLTAHYGYKNAEKLQTNEYKTV